MIHKVNIVFYKRKCKLANEGCPVMLVLSISGLAGAESYIFEPNDHDLWDLEHKRYYTWGIDFDLPGEETIVGASLFFNDIKNWRYEENDLWVHLLDEVAVGAYQGNDYGHGQTDYFDEQGVLLNQWEDIPNIAQDITYEFDSSELESLSNYLADGNFGLGFDPDCHFYNNGIKLTIETKESTGAVVTPEPATMFLLSFGFIGLAAFRKKFKS